MRPRPTSATNHQVVAVAMFLLTGCIWWRAAPFVIEEIGNVRAVLGLESRSDPTVFTSGVDDSSAMLWPAPASQPPMPAGGFHDPMKAQFVKMSGPK